MGRGRGKKDGKDPNKPKRPIGPYMCFVKEERATVTERNPTLPFGQIGKILGEQWRNMSEADKAPYVAMATQDKDRHTEEMKGYVPPPPKMDDGKRGRGRKNKDPNKPKKALSAYTCFVKEERPKLTAANPSLTFGQVGKALGEKWNNLPEKTRAKYQKIAENDKARHMAEMQTYAAMAAANKMAGGKGKKEKKDPSAPKRPMSAYTCFVKQERPKLTKQQPNLSFGEGGKKLAERWRSLDAHQRAPYEKAATADKKRFEAEMAKFNGK